MSVSFQLILVCVFATVLFKANEAHKCPAEFLRLSNDHSYCQPHNKQCKVLKHGVSEDDKKLILETHNRLRSTIALGNDNPEGLPTAANMVQMVWDHTLADIAQEYAYQCLFEHDCGDCRSTADYSVGQNLGQWPQDCVTEKCEGSEDEAIKKSDWKSIVELFYNERKYVDSSLVQSYTFDLKYGHFSQLAWSKTWRVGCGYTSYLNGKKSLLQLYVCNYAVSGNWADVPIYESGPPCSDCPQNSCCGDTCTGGDSYPGLCKLNDSKKEPVWKNTDGDKRIFYDCKFDDKCQFSISGTDNWEIYDRVFGNTALTVLNGGETTTLTFLQPILPSGPFCLDFLLRLGPNVAGQEQESSLQASIRMGDYDPWIVDVGMPSSDFIDNYYICFYKNTTFSLTYTIPEGAPQQYVEIKRIYAFEGQCPS